MQPGLTYLPDLASPGSPSLPCPQPLQPSLDPPVGFPSSLPPIRAFVVVISPQEHPPLSPLHPVNATPSEGLNSNIAVPSLAQALLSALTKTRSNLQAPKRNRIPICMIPGVHFIHFFLPPWAGGSVRAGAIICFHSRGFPRTQHSAWHLDTTLR